jgi:predicted Zn-dependent peptidase
VLAGLLLIGAPDFTPTSSVAVSCLENLRGKVGRGRVEIVVGSGALDEAEEQRGVAHLLEHLLLRPLDFSDKNATTSWDFTSYYWDASGEELEGVAIRLVRAVREAAFSNEAFELEQKIVQNELEDRHQTEEGIDPIFGDTPLARSPGGTRASVARLTAEDARRFHREHYRKGNIAVLLRGAVDCAAMRRALAQELAAIPDGPPAARVIVSDREPGPRAFPSATREFRQGFYWYEASPEDEVVLRIAIEHLELRALEELRKARGLTYSPSGLFHRRGGGGLIELTVKGDEPDEADAFFAETVEALRRDPHPRRTLEAAIAEVAKDIENDGVRSGLAAIRGEPQPITILQELTDARLTPLLGTLLDHRRSFGTATPQSNVASLVVLGLFGAVVFGALFIVAKRVM